MISPLPRNKRAKNPHEPESDEPRPPRNSNHTGNGAPDPEATHADLPPEQDAQVP